jgi:gluconolactonase
VVETSKKVTDGYCRSNNYAAEYGGSAGGAIIVTTKSGGYQFHGSLFGLPKFFGDPRKELNFSGVYSIHKGKLQLVSADFTGPNGIAFSPDENYLYVGDWDEKKKVVMRYEVTADGKLTNGKLFFDMTSAPGEDAIDGVKVD